MLECPICKNESVNTDRLYLCSCGFTAARKCLYNINTLDKEESFIFEVSVHKSTLSRKTDSHEISVVSYHDGVGPWIEMKDPVEIEEKFNELLRKALICVVLIS